MEELAKGQDLKDRAEELVSMVAHDLRNPIGCIEGYAAMMLDREFSKEERTQALQRILTCSRFAEKVIEDLLDSAALERRSLPVRKAPLQLPEVLRKALDSMQHTAATRQATLVFQGPAAHRMVLADAARIQQVVQNLVGNALKHVEPGTGRVEVKLFDLDGEMVVEVSDNGSGIEPEHLGRIFEKFFRADDVSRGSLGLGLYIAREIVALHGGRLWARSEGKGRGASFYFSIPKHDPEKAFREFRAAQQAATPPQRPTVRRFALPSLDRSLGFALAASALVLAAHLLLSRSPVPASDFRDAYSASAGPLR